MVSDELRPNQELVVAVLRNPGALATMPPALFSRLIDQARRARLLGWLLDLSDAAGASSARPVWLQDRLVAHDAMAREWERALRWEIDRLHRALDGVVSTWVLLKGAGYLAAGLRPGRGRQVADLDVLVPESELSAAEAALNQHGWHTENVESYDNKYYRTWMHELPPLTHVERRSVVDLHHAILPKTSRLRPATERLLAGAVEVAPGVRVLSPEHMVLHAAVHLFHDGEVAGAIRDLVDVHYLIETFSQNPEFPARLVDEARTLGLTRPLYYTLRYSARFLGTDISPTLTEAMARWGPPLPIAAAMDGFVMRALQGDASKRSSLSAFALYARAHWLRMPPWLLIRHLTTKALKRDDAK